MKKKNIAVILASGRGERTGLSIAKQFLKIAGKTVFEHTVQTFEEHQKIDEIIIISNINYIEQVQELILKNNYKKITKVLAGGKTRRESSYIGISSIKDLYANVLIHDAVRPFMPPPIIDNCIEALKTHKAVDVAIESADTLIRIDKENFIEEIPDRKYYRKGQTPQAFDIQVIKKAHELANNDKDVHVTDDCGLVLKYGLAKIFVINGDTFNHKITYPIDIAIADKLFQMKSIQSEQKNLSELKDKTIAVFGASRGIGKAILDMAGAYGAKVYGFSRSNGVDVTDFKTIQKALELVKKEQTKIDYIVNTAGILKLGKLNCREISDIYNEININYIGCVNIAQLAREYLKETNGGLLFYTSSSYTRGRALYAVYSSTKAAIVNLTQALSEEWQEDKIRINCICPERTATPMRFENFGNEPKSSLCSVKKVASASLNTLLSDFSGQVIDVKRGV